MQKAAVFCINQPTESPGIFYTPPNTHYFHTQTWYSMIMEFIFKQEYFFKKHNLFPGFQLLCIYVFCCRNNLDKNIKSS